MRGGEKSQPSMALKIRVKKSHRREFIMTQVQTETTNRISWKAEAEKEKARADFYKSLIEDSLDAMKSVEVLLAAQYNVTVGGRCSDAEREAGWAHYEDGRFIEWMLDALALDIKGVDADHNVGDCKREFYAEKLEAEEKGESFYDDLEKRIQRCTICRKNQKRSKLGFFTENIQGRHAQVLRDAAVKSATLDLKSTKGHLV